MLAFGSWSCLASLKQHKHHSQFLSNSITESPETSPENHSISTIVATYLRVFTGTKCQDQHHHQCPCLRLSASVTLIGQLWILAACLIGFLLPALTDTNLINPVSMFISHHNIILPLPLVTNNGHDDVAQLYVVDILNISFDLAKF